MPRPLGLSLLLGVVVVTTACGSHAASAPQSNGFRWSSGLVIVDRGKVITTFSGGRPPRPIDLRPGQRRPTSALGCQFVYHRPISIRADGSFGLVGDILMNNGELRSHDTFRVSLNGTVISSTRIRLSYSFSDLTRPCSVRQQTVTATLDPDAIVHF